VIEVKELQPENALLSMEVIESGIIIEVKELQSSNALLLIEVTEFGMSYDVFVLPQGYNINIVLSLFNNTPSIDE